MDSNELNRRMRYALSLDDADVVDILRLSEFNANAETVAAWRQKEGDSGYQACPPEAVHAFLDGLITQCRGARKADTSGAASSVKALPKDRIDNNDVLKRLRIALSLRSDEIHALIVEGGGKLSAGEVGAFFRKPDARNYRRCGDQVVRWFLAGLANRRNATG